MTNPGSESSDASAWGSPASTVSNGRPEKTGEAIPVGDLVWILLRLKLRLLTRSRDGFGGALQVLGAILLCAGVVGTIIGVVVLRNDAVAPTAIMVGAVSLSVSWALFSLVLGGERFLNPRPFTLLPLPMGRLLFGFMISAFIGLLGSAAAVVALSVLIHAGSLVGGVVLAVAALIFWVTLILAGRVAVAASAFLQRRRRGRDLTMAVTAFGGMGVAVIMQFLVNVADWVSLERLESMRRVFRWIPWGWAPEAMGAAIEGRYVGAMAWLVPAALFPVALFGLWRALMGRVLSMPSERVTSTSSAPLVPAFLQARSNQVLVASFSRTMLQMKRDPRELIQFAGFLPLLVVGGLPFFDVLTRGDDWLVLVSITWGAAVGMLAANLFGADDVTTTVDLLVARDLRSILLGKALVRLVAIAPAIMLSALLIAASTGGWQFLPTSVVLAGSLAVCSTALGMIVSVRHAYPMPDGLGFNANNMSNSLLPGILVLGLSLAAPLLLAPVLVPSLLASFFWSVPAGLGLALLGVPYSYFVFTRCAGRATTWLAQHQPEFLAALSRSAN